MTVSDHEIRDKLIRLETIIGDDSRGVLSELKSLKKSVEALKGWQLKVMGSIGAAAVIAQIAIQVFIK